MKWQMFQQLTVGAFVLWGVSLPYRRKFRTVGERRTSRHFGHGHQKALSWGKTMCPHFSQIWRPFSRTFISVNTMPETQ